MIELPARLKEVLDAQVFAHLTTLDPDGAPQASAMWVTRDGDHIVMNTAKGRRKYRNMSADPRVAISVSSPDDDYVNFSIQGRVVEMRESDGVDVIDALARKYTEHESYPWLTPGMVRVTLIIEATRIASNR
jgi:PPOX class probable F420-dependent enzyme